MATRRFRAPASVCAGLLAVLASLPLARAPAQGVVLPHSEQFSLASRDRARDYRVFVYAPATPAPARGFPVLYVLDGNDSFATVAHHARRLYGETLQTGYGPAIVVAIGYPIDDSHDEVRRTFDLTPVAPEGSLPPWGGGQDWPRTGGAAEFLAFIEDTVKPGIARRHRIDRDRETLMGHSFGGLFTLHTLFTRPEAFDNYVAVSASIWYGGRMLLDEADAFAVKLREGGVRKPLPRVALIVGECEQTPGECGSALIEPDAERREFLAYARQVDNAKDLHAKLQPLADRGLTSELVLIPCEQHTTVVPAGLARGVRFALSQPQ